MEKKSAHRGCPQGVVKSVDVEGEEKHKEKHTKGVQQDTCPYTCVINTVDVIWDKSGRNNPCFPAVHINKVQGMSTHVPGGEEHQPVLVGWS